MAGKGLPLPKFGEWDVNDPASAEDFTVKFNKARNEKRSGGESPDSCPPQDESTYKHPSTLGAKPHSKKWFCCMQPASAESCAAYREKHRLGHLPKPMRSSCGAV